MKCRPERREDHCLLQGLLGRRLTRNISEAALGGVLYHLAHHDLHELVRGLLDVGDAGGGGDGVPPVPGAEGL